MNATTVLLGMLPEHLLLAGILLVLIIDIASARPRDPFLPSLLAVVAAAAAATWLYVTGYGDAPFPGQFSVDPQAALAKAILLGLTVPVLLLARQERADSRFMLLLLSSLYGACLMLSADSLLTLFLGIELMSLPVYALVVLGYRRPESAEAAFKYLILGGVGTATLLLGISFTLGASGSLSSSAFVSQLARDDSLALAAVALVLVAFFLKAAVAPFHTWAPDAYEAASVPVTAYMATVIKGAVLFAVLRLLGESALPSDLLLLVAVLPLVSIVWGNLAAMRQASFRRLIAYSSIAHAGYLFYALLGDGDGRFEAVAFYVLVYGITNLLAFACLPPHADDAARDRLDNLKGLFQRSPWAAVLLAIALLSLAGIPPLPGFVAKFLIFKSVMEAGHTVFAVLGLVSSYLGIYFYLRVIQFMFMSVDSPSTAAVRLGRFSAFAGALCLGAVLWLAVFPGWVLGWF